jgi:large subunit ribosomal protein L23
MRDARQVILRPIVSEKSFKLIEEGRYTFEVDKRATKPEISQSIAEIFGVTVKKVNVMNVTGKPRRVRFRAGHTRSWKKAIVTLAEGDSIDLYEAS